MNQAESMSFPVTIRLPEGEPETSPAFYRVAGVMVLTRLILGAAAAGAKKITVTGSYAEIARSRCSGDQRLKELKVIWGGDPGQEERGISVEANVVVGSPVWQALAGSDESVFVPGAPAMHRTGTDDPRALWYGPPPIGAYVIPVRSMDDVPDAKKAIFANVTKSTSGPISRNINALLSIPISRVLCELGVTPNQMTLVTTIVGLISAWFVASGTLVDVAIGGALFQICAALDRVDGELARSTFRAPPVGAWLDTLGDNLVYFVFVVCLITGYHQYTQTHQLATAGWILPLGISMVIVMLVLVGGMTWYLLDNDQPGTMTAVHQDLGQKMDAAGTNWLFKVLDRIKILGKRDSFSFAVFLLAVTPVITDHALGYHLLFWASMAVILFISIHFAMAILISRRQDSTLVS